MKVFIAILGTIGALLILLLIFIYSGVYNVTASKSHTAPVRWALNTIQRRSIESHAHSKERITPVPNAAQGYEGFASGLWTIAGLKQFAASGRGVSAVVGAGVGGSAGAFIGACIAL
jgi:hypothetical protein